MSKIIKLTQENLEEVFRDFASTMQNVKLSDGKVTYTKSFGAVDRKAELYFTEMAYLKMVTLVREFDKEVAWHGVATRDPDATKDVYHITDILVYPQEVTGATVNTDQEKYQTWLMKHDDDVFNNIRMQGHSHVNMGVTPSSVDTSLYDRILEQLDEDMFYIFLIWNKRGEKHVKIYDMKKNILFETADVTVKIADDNTGIEAFLRNAKEMVQSKPATVSTGTYGSYNSKSNTYGGGYGYNGYYSGYYGGGNHKNEYTSPVGSSNSKIGASEQKPSNSGGFNTKPSKSKKKKKEMSNAGNSSDPDCWLGNGKKKNSWCYEDDYYYYDKDGYSYYKQGGMS